MTKEIEYDEKGMPYACTIRDDIDLPPVPDHLAFGLRVIVDGELSDRCVAYNRKTREIWQHKRDEHGEFVIENDALVVEKVFGDIEVEPSKP